MARNRQAKQHRRFRRKQQTSIRDQRRQQRLSLPMETARGLSMFVGIHAFIDTFRKHRRVQDVPTFLASVEALNLLKIQEHKAGIAQAVVSICRLYPEQVDGWKKQFPDVLASARYIVPEEGSDRDLEIFTDSDVDRRMVQWLITGDEAAVSEVADHAKVNDHALTALQFYTNQHPDLADLLEDLQERPLSWPYVKDEDTSARLPTKPLPAKEQATEAIRLLQDHIPEHLKHHVAMLTQSHDARSWVVATHGDMALDMPKTVAGKKVIVRPILPVEQRLLDEYRDEMEDPL